MSRSRRLAAWALATWALVACEDLRDFRGTWSGQVSGDAAQRVSFEPDARAALTIDHATSVELAATVTLPGQPRPLAFALVQGANADVLANMQLSGDPLRTYMGFLDAAAGGPLLAFVSLYAGNRVELRVIRGPQEIYGVFRMKR